jgi:hypothetical protein
MIPCVVSPQINDRFQSTAIATSSRPVVHHPIPSPDVQGGRIPGSIPLGSWQSENALGRSHG